MRHVRNSGSYPAVKFRNAAARFRKRWLIAGALVLGAGSAIFYSDLLIAAFSSNPFPLSLESVSRGNGLWKKDCEVCHGAQGRGDGPVATSLRKRPKDLTKIATPPIFPDGIVAYRIANGGEVMPAWKSVLTSEEIWDLVNFIRFQRRDEQR